MPTLNDLQIRSYNHPRWKVFFWIYLAVGFALAFPLAIIQACIEAF